MSRRTLYNAGELVWAKVSGYPWWPAKVADFDQEDNSYNAVFINHASYAILRPNKLRPFSENLEELKKQKKGGRQFRRAVRLAEEEAEAVEHQEAQGGVGEEQREQMRQERPQAQTVRESQQMSQTPVVQVIPAHENPYTKLLQRWNTFFASNPQPAIHLAQPEVPSAATRNEVAVVPEQPQPAQHNPFTVIRLPIRPVARLPVQPAPIHSANNQIQTKFTASELRSLEVTEDNVLQLLQKGAHEECDRLFQNENEAERLRKKMKKVLLQKFGMGNRPRRQRAVGSPLRKIHKAKMDPGCSMDKKQNQRKEENVESRIRKVKMDFMREFVNRGAPRSSAEAQSNELVNQMRNRYAPRSTAEIFQGLKGALSILRDDFQLFNGIYGSFLKPTVVPSNGDGNRLVKGEETTVTENSSNVKIEG